MNNLFVKQEKIIVFSCICMKSDGIAILLEYSRKIVLDTLGEIG